MYDSPKSIAVVSETGGHLASNLPEELREHHRRIYDAAVANARELGWDPELGDDD